MKVQVEHGLPRFRIHIENGSISLLIHTVLLGHLLRNLKHVRQ